MPGNGPAEGLQEAVSYGNVPSVKREPSSRSTLVPCSSGGVAVLPAGSRTLQNKGWVLSEAAYRALKSKQRGANNFWLTSYFFPDSNDVFERNSLKRATEFCCLGIYGCEVGDCLGGLETHDVHAARQHARQRAAAMTTNHEGSRNGIEGKMLNLLHFDLWTRWNGTIFAPISFALDKENECRAPLCAAAYAVLIGVKGSSAQTVFSRIKSNQDPPESFPNHASHLKGTSAQENMGKAAVQARESIAFTQLRGYVHQEIAKKGEMNPAPGASRTKETVVTKRSWKSKWEICRAYFRNKDLGEEVGNISMFKRAWRKEVLLSEKQASTHSKCGLCKGFEVSWQRLFGVQGDEAARSRTFLTRAWAEHEEQHMGAREVVDEHSWLSVTAPRQCWTIMCDAMTHRTTELPRYNTSVYRLSKEASGALPKWGFKLTATYTFGYGFCPFMTHDSLEHGADLVWTIVWKTIEQLYEHYGFYPDVLFLVLDNTTGENKTAVTLAIASWLVASGRFKQVRVFFLLVGHTHVLIDQIFGTITKYLKGTDILLPEDLCSMIDAALAKNPQYKAKKVTWLRSLWNFWGWIRTMDVPKDVVDGIFKRQTAVHDKEGKFDGMYDFVFRADEHKLALLSYRERHNFPWRPDDGGIQIIFKLPTQPPELKKIAPYSKWGLIKSKSIEHTILAYLNMSVASRTMAMRDEILNRWKAHISDIPSDVALLKSEFKLVFQHFEFSPQSTGVPRLCLEGRERNKEHEPATEAELENEVAYDMFLAENFCMRRQPFAYDPVCHAQQPKSVYEKEKERYQKIWRDAHGCGGPTRHAKSLVLGGSFLFVLRDGMGGGGVFLAKVENLANNKTPRSSDLAIKCTLYRHTPQPGVAGLFGTFKQEAKGQAKQGLFTRAQVLVYNVQLDVKSKRVGVPSLRMLAAALPDQYPFPEEVPDSHLPGTGTGKNRNRNRNKNGDMDVDNGGAGSSASVAQRRQKRKQPRFNCSVQPLEKEAKKQRAFSAAPSAQCCSASGAQC